MEKPTPIRAAQLDAPGELRAFKQDNAQSEQHILRFGEWQWKPVSNESAVVFVDDQHIAPPFRVETRGLAVLVNGVAVDYEEWPDPLYQDQKPTLPTGISEESVPEDLLGAGELAQSWPALMSRWITSHVPKTDQEAVFLAEYRKLPFVGRVGIDVVPFEGFGGETSRRVAFFRTKAGERFLISRSVQGAVARPSSQALQRLHGRARRIRAYLEQGGLILIGNGECISKAYASLHIIGHIREKSAAWWALPEVVYECQSNRSVSRFTRWFDSFRDGMKRVPNQCLFEKWLRTVQTNERLERQLSAIQLSRPESFRPPSFSSAAASAPESEQAADRESEPVPESLHVSIGRMADLLEQEKYRKFVETYVRPEARNQFKYAGSSPSSDGLAYNLDTQSDVVQGFIDSFRNCQVRMPRIQTDSEAIFTYWVANSGPMEARFVQVKGRWYFR